MRGARRDPQRRGRWPRRQGGAHGGRNLPLTADRVGLVYGAGTGSVTALRTVSLNIEVGEYVALRGPSGSGKTSLLHCLGGLLRPTNGEVRWAGRRLDDVRLDSRIGARGSAFAYLFQGGNLLPTFTAAENIAFAAYVAGVTSDAGPAELLGAVELHEKGDALPDELSGGEQLRVALARALAQNAQVLLADEPTGQLDRATSSLVLDLIDAVRSDKPDVIVVLATHDAAVADRADRVVEIVDGTVQRPQ